MNSRTFTDKHPIHAHIITEAQPAQTLSKPLNPLHTQAMVDEINQTMVGGYARHSHRRTGKTTASALAVISQAIFNPGKQIPIVDHHPTHQASRYKARMIADMIQALDLKHMVIGSDKLGDQHLTFGVKS
jgi:hypothetical protein